MTRDEALRRLERPALDPETIEDEFAYIAQRLDITIEELRGYLEMPKTTYRDYRNQVSMFNLGANVLKMLGIERTIKR